MEIVAKVKFFLYFLVFCDDLRYGCCFDGIIVVLGQNYVGCVDEDFCKVWKLFRVFFKIYCFFIMLNYSVLIVLDLIIVKLLEFLEFVVNIYL